MQLNELKKDPSRPLNDVRVPMARNTRRASEFLHEIILQDEEEHQKKWWTFCYDKEKKTCCERSCMNWVQILSYSIFYIIFLCTYTMIILYISLYVVKTHRVYDNLEAQPLVMNSACKKLGLTATPSAVNKMAVISYRDGEPGDYEKYVTALENVVSNARAGAHKQLGPCGAAPFGYGSAPCVVVRINKRYNSVGLPLESGVNSSNIPHNVKLLASTGSKLWLHCNGNKPYDAEHIGTIKYYPDSPGFDPGLYAPGNELNMSFIAVQFSNFTKGMLLAVQCSLYYEGGTTSTVDFVLYVMKSRKS